MEQPTTLERILHRLVEAPPPADAPELGPCLVWTGKPRRDGYAQTRIGQPNRRNILVHRLVYTLLVGPIGEGMEIDHLCLNRACARIGHLEQVTGIENKQRRTRRITSCPSGHPYSGANLRVYRGRRFCRQCQRNANRAARAA